MGKIAKEDAVQWYAQNRGLYKKLSLKIQNIITELLEEANITVHAITNRAKDVDSFRSKIEDPKYDDPINQITDFSGIRVIAYVENDLEPIRKIIEEAFEIDEENSLDKADILGIDKVGYKSIHYVCRIKDNRLDLPEYKKFKGLKFEVQIRTILQHAWAEIEHDRNYKFNGVLPPEIKRRFGLLAAALESADREFNRLSTEIDQIERNVIEAKTDAELKNLGINSTTVKSFLSNYFRELVVSELLDPDLRTKDASVIDELEKFGIKTLKDLEKIIPKDFNKVYKSFATKHFSKGSFLSILRNFMIISDSKKYFEVAWNQDWQGLSSISEEIMSNYINLDEVIKKYNLISQQD